MNSYTRKFFALCALPGALFLPFLSQAECKRAALDLPVTISGTRALIDANYGLSVRGEGGATDQPSVAIAAISRSGKLQNPDFLDNLALVRFRLGDYDKSIGAYDAALKIRPKNAWTLYGRGLAKLKKNNRSEGEADIAEAVSIAPGVAQAYKKMELSP